MTTSTMFPALSTQVHKTKQKSTCCATVHGMRSPNADFPRDKLLIIVCLEISPSKQTYAKYTAVSLTTGNLVWYCQSTKAKVTLWSVDLIEGLNCWNML